MFVIIHVYTNPNHNLPSVISCVLIKCLGCWVSVWMAQHGTEWVLNAKTRSGCLPIVSMYFGLFPEAFGSFLFEWGGCFFGTMMDSKAYFWVFIAWPCSNMFQCITVLVTPGFTRSLGQRRWGEDWSARMLRVFHPSLNLSHESFTNILCFILKLGARTKNEAPKSSAVSFDEEVLILSWSCLSIWCVEWNCFQVSNCRKLWMAMILNQMYQMLFLPHGHHQSISPSRSPAMLGRANAKGRFCEHRSGSSFALSLVRCLRQV